MPDVAKSCANFFFYLSGGLINTQVSKKVYISGGSGLTVLRNNIRKTSFSPFADQ